MRPLIFCQVPIKIRIKKNSRSQNPRMVMKYSGERYDSHFLDCTKTKRIVGKAARPKIRASRHKTKPKNVMMNGGIPALADHSMIRDNSLLVEPEICPICL